MANVYWTARGLKSDKTGGTIKTFVADGMTLANVATAVAGDTDYAGQSLGDAHMRSVSEALATGHATEVTLALILTALTEVAVDQKQYNGAAWESAKGNTYLTLLSSAARTADPLKPDLINSNARGIMLTIDTTAFSGSPSVVVTIEGKDDASGKWLPLLVSAAITGTGTVVMRIYPGLTPISNLTANDVLPRTFRVKPVHANTDSITYSIGASLIL